MSLDETQVVAALTEGLTHKYPQVPVDDIRSVVRQEWRTYEGAPVRAYIPVLVERAVLAELDRSHAL